MRCAIADTIKPTAGLVRNNDATLTDLTYDGTFVTSNADVLELPPGVLPLGVYARVSHCSGTWAPGRDPGEVLYVRGLVTVVAFDARTFRLFL